MKKLFVLCTSLVILTLAACSEENTQKPDSNQKETTEKTTAKDQLEATTKTEKEEKESTTSDTNEADGDQVSPFEEYPVVQKEIKDIDSMQPVVETDNPNKRIVLYQEADGKKKYKTIFIKRTDRLKIIELNENGLLFNEVISK